MLHVSISPEFCIYFCLLIKEGGSFNPGQVRPVPVSAHVVSVPIMALITFIYRHGQDQNLITLIVKLLTCNRLV